MENPPRLEGYPMPDACHYRGTWAECEASGFVTISDPFSYFSNEGYYDKCEYPLPMPLPNAECWDPMSAAFDSDPRLFSNESDFVSPSSLQADLALDTLNSPSYIADSDGTWAYLGPIGSTPRRPRIGTRSASSHWETTSTGATSSQGRDERGTAFLRLETSTLTEDAMRVEWAENDLVPKPVKAPTNTGEKSNMRALRTASRKSKNKGSKQKREAPPKPSQTQEQPLSYQQVRARECHNKVEKQYRERLNQHFLHLLEALPADLQASCTENPNAIENRSAGQYGGSGGERNAKFSKGEVLDMARRYIRTLEQKTELLHKEQDQLLRKNCNKLGEGFH
ncbi:hypothetical protein B0T10DRAFT_587881 [Thelonectria olida]|uniref:BHLH domain-containing protein n=1 Tax=Thelonectria olida TaxID=1576542 RepID=A0A9P8VTB7_9HYPO|nr:hypothetical protein B0T10DRAFT_587881 [Thelonectria olida]